MLAEHRADATHDARLVGVAADIKINYLLFGLGVAWALRRSWAALFAAAAGGALVLVPSYLPAGPAAVHALFARNYLASVDNFYQLFAGSQGHRVPHEFAISVVAFAAVAALMLWRLPDGAPALPAVRPALAVSVAWVAPAACASRSASVSNAPAIPRRRALASVATWYTPAIPSCRKVASAATGRAPSEAR